MVLLHGGLLINSEPIINPGEILISGSQKSVVDIISSSEAKWLAAKAWEAVKV